MYLFLAQLILQHAVKQTCKFAMQAFIAADQLIAECKPGHQAPFLHPENRTKAATEENTFHCCKCHKSFGKTSILDPAKRPFCFFLYSRHRVDRMKQAILFFWILDIRIDK